MENVVSATSKKSLNDAIQKALKDCKLDSCRIYAQYKNSCGAIALGLTKDGKYNIYSATANTLSEADDNTFDKCIYDKNHTEKCAIVKKDVQLINK